MALTDLRRRLFGPSSGERIADLSESVTRLEASNDALLKRVYRESEASGVPMNMGQFETELNTGLRGAARWDTYAKMQTDPHVKAALRSSIQPLLLADWEYMPGSDKGKDIEAAELCNANLLCKPNDTYGAEFYTETSWEQRLTEILDMLASGYSMFAFNVKEAGGKLVYDRIQWLEPSSVDPRGWQLDNEDRIEQIKRTYKMPNGQYRYCDPIDANRLALYVWDFKGARFEGQPFLRSMYGAWFRKDHALRHSGVAVQKFANPMPILSYPNEFKDDAELQSQFEITAEQSRGTSPDKAFAKFPMDKDGKKVEIDYPGSQINEVDRLRGIIDGENAEIGHGGSTKSQLLGETSSGSRALGESIKGEELPLRQSAAAVICGYENGGIANLAGLAPRLVLTNLAGVTRMPQLVCRGLGPDEGLEYFREKVEAWKAGVVPKTPESRRQLCEPVGFDLSDEAYEIEEPPPVVPGGNGEAGKEPGDGEDETPDEGQDDDALPVAASLESADDFRKRIAPMLEPVQEGRPKAGGFRYPNRLELEVCNLAAVGEAYRVGEQDVKTTLRRIRRDMTDELMGRLKAGKINTRNLESQRRSKFRKASKSKAALLVDIKRIGEQGMAHVTDEIKRQETD